MDKKDNIFSCFFNVGYDPTLNEQEHIDLADSFRVYIWGNKGISNIVKKLEHKNYGKDLELILFQFYVKPTQIEIERLKTIESYRKKERAIGVPIIITDENFFNKSEKERYDFLKEIILQKMDLLAEVVKKKKLDTNMDLLKSDLIKVLNEFHAT